MSEVIEIFDIAEVDRFYRQMPPINGVTPEDLRGHFIANYISKQGMTNPMMLNSIVQNYLSGKDIRTRYLIDKNEPLIDEIYRHFRNEQQR